jgi:hypothetical protein
MWYNYSFLEVRVFHFFFAKVRVIEVRVNQMWILDKIIDKNVDVELIADNVFL